MDDFRRLLMELVGRYGGSKGDLARAIGVTPSRLSHLLTDGRAISAPSTELCLRLATVTGASASKVLRAAGKGRVADMLEDLYGAPAERRQMFGGITPREQQYLEAWRLLPPREQRALLLIVESINHTAHTAAEGVTPFRRDLTGEGGG